MQSNEELVPADSATQRQRMRLPVNPRRIKVNPQDRKRVVRACNACNLRRVKCSGGQPCERCARQVRECEYPAPESDKCALKNEVDRLRRRCAALEKNLHSIPSDGAADALRHLHRGNSATSSSTAQSSHPDHLGPDDSDASDGRMLRDPDGTARYLGETSGATFLDHLKNFMFTLVPVTFQDDCADSSSFVSTIGQYQTFDSRPLPNPDVNPVWLPSRTEMSAMLFELCYYIQDGNGDFASGGIYWWGDLSVVPSPGVSSASLNAMTTDESFRPLAFHHVCFALVSSVGHTNYRHSEQHTGEAYFKRARMLLGNPLDTVRFTPGDVPVLTLMAFYLIEINRRDAAYMYLGLAVRIAVMHGSFRSCPDEPSRRTMWTLYVLDRWLSVLMGRPPTIADEAIRLVLPSDAVGLPSSAGLRAHVELSRISNYIVCETFKIAPRQDGPNQSASTIDTALEMLHTWQWQLPHQLQMPADLNHEDPTCCILHMAHNQLMVLTTRPIFFAAVKQAVAQRSIHGEYLPEEFDQTPHIPICCAAAHRNLQLAQRLIKSGRRLLQAGLHFVFNSAVILLLQRFMRSTAQPEFGTPSVRSPSVASVQNEEFEPNIQFAIQSFEEEARTGTHYPRDCCKILQDLDVLTERYSRCQEQLVHQRNATDTSQPSSLANRRSTFAADVQPSQNLLTEGNAMYAEVVTWIQCSGLQLQNSFFI
ncbi:hypothetical protein HBI56_008950 [Parastagonospora nodorum]|uniref:Zn(2)-C6 fungal-type domain-containing protein n=1 Tax=Phaeosphaeria nodorum (strain SN15 / ATCC MYA-4574 / FGSC 10173) TaxID=321614 RepID=A0A7U2EQ22_PHANO|nr:hypothetical protein HBH56_236420 [Parastagonospora nodorum]QRC90924.1 hypothetical protein JI435_004390 [Parastagonospora nodorum SN15]KAH3934904.1 hypothetical protein HBH54_046310 [Parastagonospora nodorum]KAH3987234.1 hypothetical protein HBH51_010700 [Parastagonospora nodorum]KAH4000848.1 hypothetical protein HBI10_096380 [Parastagonospora nodorum]